MKVKMKVLATASIALAAVLAVSGCSATGSTSGGDFELTYIQTNLGNPYNDSISAGLEKAADELGFELTVVGPAAAGAADQIPFIEDAITKGADAILINANDAAAVTPSLEQAVAAGIKVFAINSDQLADIRTTAFTPVDFGIVPGDQLDLLSSLIDGSGDFAILSATTTATFQKTVVDAQLALLDSNPAYADLNLVKTAYGDDDPQKSATETQALITAYPDLKAILSPTTVGLAAAAQAVESAGLGGKIQVTGLGTPDQMRAFVESGTVAAFQLWDPILHGYVTGYFVIAILAGEIAGAAGDSLEVPGSGTLTIGPDGVLFTQETLTSFNADNIADYSF
jgi:rhamnose transport system substrate-binding protein